MADGYTTEQLAGMTPKEQFILQHALMYPSGCPDGTVLPTGNHTPPKWEHPAAGDAEAQWAILERLKARGVYRAVNPMTGLAGNKKGTAKHVAEIRCVVFDIDCVWGVHEPSRSGRPDPAREQAARLHRIFTNAGVKFTVELDTGGGELWVVTLTRPASPGKPGRTPKLLAVAADALEKACASLGIACDSKPTKNPAGVIRVAGGFNRKTKPAELTDEMVDSGWTQARLDSIPDDIRNRPVRLTAVSGGAMTPDDLGKALGRVVDACTPEDEGTDPAPAVGSEHEHQCGAPGPEGQVCIALPMSRVLRELSRFSFEQDIPDGPLADSVKLTWTDDPDRGTSAELGWGANPDGGEERSYVVGYGNSTSDMLGSGEQAPQCTWWYLRNAHCGGQSRLARALIEHFAGGDGAYDVDGIIIALELCETPEEVLAAFPGLKIKPAAPAIPPVPAAVPVTLTEAEETFRTWLGENYDMDSMLAVAAARAEHDYPGDPVWLLVVSGSGNAKTETVCALRLTPRTLIKSDISSGGALLSGTSARERAKGATGGLLPLIGDSGVLIIKDLTTILSKQKNVRDEVLAMLREVYDGQVSRSVGTDGGRELEWAGHCTMIGAVTTAWDEHRAVIAAFGDRWLLIRTDSSAHRKATAKKAIANSGSEADMRQELADAMAGLIAGADRSRVTPVTEKENDILVDAADLVTRARTGVITDFKGEVLDAHAHESPTRFAKQLTRVFQGALAVGADRGRALRLAIRVARDSLSPMRLAIIDNLGTHTEGATPTVVAIEIDKPRTSVKREIDALHLLGVLTYHLEKRESKKAGEAEYNARMYSLADGINPVVLRMDDVEERAQAAPEPAGSLFARSDAPAPGGVSVPQEVVQVADAGRDRCGLCDQPLPDDSPSAWCPGHEPADPGDEDGWGEPSGPVPGSGPGGQAPTPRPSVPAQRDTFPDEDGAISPRPVPAQRTAPAVPGGAVGGGPLNWPAVIRALRKPHPSCAAWLGESTTVTDGTTVTVTLKPGREMSSARAYRPMIAEAVEAATGAVAEVVLVPGKATSQVKSRALTVRQREWERVVGQVPARHRMLLRGSSVVSATTEEITVRPRPGTDPAGLACAAPALRAACQEVIGLDLEVRFTVREAA